MADSIEPRAVRNHILSEGFDAVGFTKPQLVETAGRHLEEFLKRGWHGTMQWMADKAGRRANPHMLWPDVKSIIVVGINYAPLSDPLALLNRSNCGVVSVYAQGRDYHDAAHSALISAQPKPSRNLTNSMQGAAFLI